MWRFINHELENRCSRLALDLSSYKTSLKIQHQMIFYPKPHDHCHRIILPYKTKSEIRFTHSLQKQDSIHADPNPHEI